MRVFTIGFTKKNARRFFGLLKTAGAKRVVDVRLNKRVATRRVREEGRPRILQ
jgi:hypothetical protein